MPDTRVVTTAMVLAAMKQMNSRQKFAPQPISLDTLMLALNISHAALMPLIEELRLSRDVVFHPAKATTAAGNRKSGAVSLT